MPDAPDPAPTERANPRCRHLETRGTAELLALYLDEMRRVPAALEPALPALGRVVDAVAAAWGGGGRLIYAGAGTSGRLGVLDASELPPTFGVPPAETVALIAGGDAALWTAVEGAEDQADAAPAELDRIQAGPRDVVVGIAASGSTPWVLAMVRAAHTRGCRTALVCCAAPPPGALPPGCDCVQLATEPEFIAGSTRLAAGTATKLALNAITTLAMVRRGKVRDNLMIDVVPSNTKLRARAVSLVARLRACPPDEARARLERHGWNVRAAADE